MEEQGLGRELPTRGKLECTCARVFSSGNQGPRARFRGIRYPRTGCPNVGQPAPHVCFDNRHVRVTNENGVAAR